MGVRLREAAYLFKGEDESFTGAVEVFVDVPSIATKGAEHPALLITDNEKCVIHILHLLIKCLL